MRLFKQGEEDNRLKDLGTLSFSKEVAETLGLESAIILELYKTNKIFNSRSIEDLIESVKIEAPFLSNVAIEENLHKLRRVKLIEFKSQKSKKNSANNFDLKIPNKNNTESKTKISTNWIPSKETVEVLELGGISTDFAKSKLKEFKIYWTERNQARDNWNFLYRLY